MNLKVNTIIGRKWTHRLISVLFVAFVVFVIRVLNSQNKLKIENILEKTRMRIALEMKSFEYTNEMVGLSALTPETNGTPIRSVILSTWRSGSTFLGDILRAIPGSYYFDEPLMYVGNVQIRSQDDLLADVIQHLHKLLKCNFTGQGIHLKSVMNALGTFSPMCKINETFMGAFCGLFPLQVVKEVRLRAESAESLLLDTLNVKIVLLIRDPRGILSSRNRLALSPIGWSSRWCSLSKDCKDAATLCQDLVSDFNAAQYLTKKYPGRFRVIRYEDLSLNLFRVTKKVLDFFGLPFHDKVKEFLDSHTNFDAGDSYSTFRNSKNTAFAWKHKLNYPEIIEIQSKCTEAIHLWGYQNVTSVGELDGDTFNPLLRFSFDTEFH